MRIAFAHLSVVAVVLSGWIAPACADLPMTGAYVPELQAVDTLLQNFMVGKPIPGGTIAITHNDKVIYERGIGYRDEARSVLMPETALMRLASVSKPITASAIHQLAKDGQLDLNAKVFNIADNGGILNITPYNGTLGDSRLGDITVQHLLEHQGGWKLDTAGDLAFRDVQIANAMGVPSPPGIANSAKYILSRPLQFAPGTTYSYSNIGYMFLGMVVEAASGQAYESYVEDKVLAPAGIPVWEVDAGRTFATDQNSREPVYSDPSTGQNVYNPSGPSVSWPYGGWDNEKALAFGGLIASSKAIALLAQSRIAAGPEIGKKRSDYTTSPEYAWYHYGSLPGTDTLIAQRTWQDCTYSILFDRRPIDVSSYSDTLSYLLESALEGLSSWPAALVYAGDFTDDQWLTLDDVALFKQALALGSESAFTEAFPAARYLAGDFDDNRLVNASDAAGLIGALQHAGVPAEYIALVPELPGDYNRDGVVDAADYVVWRSNVGDSISLPNETISLGLVDQADYDVWRANFGSSLGPGSDAAGYPLGASAVSLPAAIPEPATLLFVTMGLAALYMWRRSGPRLQSVVLRIDAALLPLVACAGVADADIFQWEYVNPAEPSQGKRQSTTLAPDGAGVDAVPGADLSGRNLTMAYLIGADLSHADLGDYWDRITNHRRVATLTDADFTDADVRGAKFTKYKYLTGTGITLAQLYATASYQAHDLTGIGLGGNNLTAGNFAGYNLTNADFGAAKLGGTLRMVFEADAWDSTISFAPGIPVTLGGTLELTFAADMNLASQVGRMFDLFDWIGVTPTGAFVVNSPYRWDLTNLYTTGEVTLTAVPEPAILAQLLLVLGMAIQSRRRGC
jgi:CubicO group peptidase (beta-lactamase class C family)